MDQEREESSVHWRAIGYLIGFLERDHPGYVESVAKRAEARPETAAYADELREWLA